MKPDGVWQAIDIQRAGLCDLLTGLGDDQWRQPSLSARTGPSATSPPT